jgi:hypothetical protein
VRSNPSLLTLKKLLGAIYYDRGVSFYSISLLELVDSFTFTAGKISELFFSGIVNLG